MRKLMMFIALVAISFSASAQSVYAFLYDYTDNDGVKSKESSRNGTIMFVAISGDVMGVTTTMKSNVIGNWEKYENQAIEALSRNKREENKQYGSPSNGVDSYIYIKECLEYTTPSKTTYRQFGANACTPSYGYLTWGNQGWGDCCYTISNDNNQLIEWWSKGTFNGRFYISRDYSKHVYYKKVTSSDLRPNTDFLND